jgi:hypothetical protein
MTSTGFSGTTEDATMTEQQWLEAEVVYGLLWHLRDQHGAARKKVGRRKLRLLVVACFRMAWDALDGPRRTVIEGLEALADGREVTGGLDALRRLAWQPEQQGERLSFTMRRALQFAVSDDSPGAIAVNVAYNLAASAHLPDTATRSAFMAQQADLVREIFGNPFRPLPKRRFPAEVRGLAQACYDDATNVPVLADALADLGEDEAAAHCRLPGHVKGCHVVDWILGKGC